MTDRPAAPTPDGLGHLVHVPRRLMDRTGEVTTTVALDLSRFAVAWEHARASIATALQPMVDGVHTLGQALARLIDSMMERANDPAHVAGLEARYYVRGAMDPTYATPEGLRSLVRGIISPDSELAEGLYLMTPANRHLVAVSAMRGWETRGEPRLGPVACDTSPVGCAYAEAVGMSEFGSQCLGELWRCEGMTYEEPPLVAHRQWGTTRVEVHCG